MINYLRYEVRIRRGAIIGWSIGLSAFTFIYTGFYPSLPQEMLAIDLSEIELYQAIGTFEMGTFVGYFSSTILSFITLLAGIFAVVNGTQTLAGEEDNGTLEIMVTLPLLRWQIILIKGLAMVIASFIIMSAAAVASMVIFLSIESQIETNITAIDLLPPVLGAWPITILFMMISFFLGAYLPRRRTATAVATLVLVASFFANNLAPMVEALEPLQKWSPFHYYNSTSAVFTEGINMEHVLILLGASLFFWLLTMLAFHRRNITVGAWPWQRGIAGD